MKPSEASLCGLLQEANRVDQIGDRVGMKVNISSGES